MPRRLILYFIVLMTLSLSFSQGLAQTPKSKLAYRYSYVTSLSDAINVHLINPKDTNEEEQVITLPSKKGESVYHLRVSPNGQWISYIVNPNPGTGDPDSSEGQIRLYNVLTGEVRNGYPRMVFNDMAWSPDSRYLAVNMNEDEFSHVKFAAYIYDLETDQYHYVLEANTYRYGLTWSPDSTRLAVASNICSNDSCNSKIDVISVPEYDLTLSVPITTLSDTLCNLDWSPDNHYFSFEFSCDAASLWINDIFRLDTRTGDIQQVTLFTQSLQTFWASTEPTILFRNLYDSMWYDSDHLLVGVSAGHFTDGIGYDPATVQVTTNVYHTDGTSKQISSDMFSNWVKNPADGSVAFRAEKKIVRTNEDNMQMFVNQEVSVQVAKLNGDVLEILHNQPVDGHDLNWSPDGEYLVYNLHGERFPTRVYFLNQISGQTTQFDLSDPYPLLVGWVAVAN